MGLFTQKVEIGTSDLSRFETLDLTVDTGSTYTWIPREFAERMGLQPVDRRKVQLADGRIVERDGVVAPIRINGTKALPNFCLLAERGEMHLLGAVTLETFSLGVDPVNRKLMPVIAFAA